MKITTLRTTARTECPAGRECPSIHHVGDDPDHHYIVLTQVTDRATLNAFAHLIGPGEVLGTAPTSLIPEVTA